jgi:hypothetical protein
VQVIFISHSMVSVYTFKVINLFYLTKVKVLFRMCLGEVQAFKIELHTNDIGFLLSI